MSHFLTIAIFMVTIIPRLCMSEEFAHKSKCSDSLPFKELLRKFFEIWCGHRASSQWLSILLTNGRSECTQPSMGKGTWDISGGNMPQGSWAFWWGVAPPQAQ